MMNNKVRDKMNLPHEDIMMDVFERIEHSTDYSLRIELDRIYYRGFRITSVFPVTPLG
jgi:hypothetical protein